MAMKVPAKLPASAAEDAAMAAATEDSAGCAEAGFVAPGMENNLICWPAGNDLAKKKTDRTVFVNEAKGPGTAVEAWLSNLICGGQAMPEAPVRVIGRLLGEVIGTEGVTNTLIVTPVAPAIGVLRKIAGWFRPRLPMIIGNMPVGLIATG